MSERDETNADRIDTIQRATPPADGVKSRLGHASLDYLAELVGTNRSHLIAWKKGSEPQLRHRIRLAELSNGRYTPDDFRTREAAAPGADGGLTLAGLAAAHAKLEESVRLLKATVDRLERQDQTPARKGSRRAQGAGGR